MYSDDTKRVGTCSHGTYRAHMRDYTNDESRQFIPKFFQLRKQAVCLNMFSECRAHDRQFTKERGALVTESACAHSYYPNMQVFKTCMLILIVNAPSPTLHRVSKCVKRSI